MTIILFLFLCIVWGTTWVAIKISLQGLPPFIGAASRFAVAILFLAAYALINRTSLKLPNRIFKLLFISALLMYIFDYGLIYWGEQYLSAGVTAIFFATFPIFTGLISNFVFKNEIFLWNKFAGLILGFTGVLTIFYDQLIQTDFDYMVTLATGSIILGAAGGAFSTVMVKKYMDNLHPVPLTLHQMIWGVLGLFFIGALNREFEKIILNTEIILAVVYLGLVGSALAFVIYYHLLKKLGAVTLSLVIYVTPLVALIADWFYFGETVALRTILGMILIFSGIALSQFQQYRAMMKKRRLVASRNPSRMD